MLARRGAWRNGLIRARFNDASRKELADARAWYAREHPALGRRFTDEIRGAVQRIESNPLAFPVDSAEVRKCVLRVFPYSLRFALRGEVALILAVSHQHREPDYWRKPTDP